MDERFVIIPSLIEFYPKFNYDFSYINQKLGAGMGLWLHTFLIVLATLAITLWYKFMQYISQKAKVVDVSFIFFISAIACVLSGYFIWNGILDFIYLVPLFIFDLKDIYVNIFVVLFLFSAFKYHKQGNIKEYYKSVLKKNK